ncbi:hypothetical protein AGLY_003123 [Aphis glycines]|uniref:Uncharacterized protein n=1 Tax=Aphis glycines TaxID=307491 RepID=A0A6G0U4K3_APHGL|nr:hypothetical protein AGLY_003123 [Aphis glycines]
MDNTYHLFTFCYKIKLDLKQRIIVLQLIYVCLIQHYLLQQTLVTAKQQRNVTDAERYAYTRRYSPNIQEKKVKFSMDIYKIYLSFEFRIKLFLVVMKTEFTENNNENNPNGNTSKTAYGARSIDLDGKSSCVWYWTGEFYDSQRSQPRIKLPVVDYLMRNFVFNFQNNIYKQMILIFIVHSYSNIYVLHRYSCDWVAHEPFESGLYRYR